ncbi:MAG: hypothetical protein LBK06_10350, partial [Planctomycetaceae bacterium]|nr:hypothetical protein [Planctomycetaceae bacterium]
GGYIAVEIKTSANTEQVKKYRQELKRLRDLIKQNDTQFKHLVGGFASLVYSTETQECILNEGLYALMPTGLDVELFVPENFQAIEF